MRPFLIHGPGSHADLIQQFIEQEFTSWSAASYWPKYTYIDHLNDKHLETGNKNYDRLTFLLYGLNHRLSGYTNGQQLHNDYLFEYYDYLNSTKIEEAKILIAWSQTSLKSLRKNKKLGGKSILEHPTPHVDYWMKINDQFYADPKISPKPGYSRFTKKMIKRMKEEYEVADFIQVHSSFVYHTFIEFGVPASKLLVNSLSINPDKFPTQVATHRKEKRTLSALYIGRLELWKGVHLLIQAVEDISGGEINLQLAGRMMPETTPFLTNCRYTKVLGELSKEKLSDAIQQADVVVLPSLNDAFGMVIIEAMLHRVPVIASTASAGPDIIVDGENGLLVEPNNFTQLKEKLEWCVVNRDRLSEMGRKAYQCVLNSHMDYHYFSRFISNLKKVNMI